MQKEREKQEYVSMIKTGELDIIVGTHVLLGNRIPYDNLGLLVIDEEQVTLQISPYTFHSFVFIT